MSDILDEIKVFRKIDKQVKQNITLFHIFGGNPNNVLFVTNKDEVFGFGCNHFGQLGLGHSKKVQKPQIISELCNKNIREFSIGRFFALALNQNNQVYGWGMNNFEQLGRGYKSEWNDYLKPEVIKSLNDIIEISCGQHHSLALTSDGQVFGWGSNSNGQVGCGKAIHNITEPIHIKKLVDIESINCSEYQSFAVTKYGLVYNWGLGSNKTVSISLVSIKPRLLIGLSNVVSIRFDFQNFYFLTNDGNIFFNSRIEERDQEKPKILKTNLKFQSLYSNKRRVLGISDNIVYELNDEYALKREFKQFYNSYMDYDQTTFGTIKIKPSTKQKYSEVYKELKEIGSGYSGQVFKVIDKFDSKLYAIKKHKRKEHESLKEVEILSKLSDKYIVKYYDYWTETLVTERQQSYLKMELFHNNLENIIKSCIRRKPIETMESIEYFNCCQLSKEIVECVQYLHELNPPIIHRDLKPSKFLVNYKHKNGRYLKLGGFAMATYDNSETHERWIVTPEYMAPEVTVQGGSDSSQVLVAKYNTKADIYGLGKIFCELFNIDINSFDEFNTKNTRETKIFWRMENQTVKMLEPIDTNRPTCSEILKNYSEWSINKKDIDKQQYLSYINETDEFDNNFLINFVKYHCDDKQDDKYIDPLKIRAFDIRSLKVKHEMWQKFRDIDVRVTNEAQCLFVSDIVQEINEQLIERDGINNFEIIKELGSGGFGNVFEVRNKETRNLFALTKIKLNENLKTLCLEYQNRAKNKLLEPIEECVVEYFDSWIQDNCFYIQMELCFCNLKTIIEQKENCFNRELTKGMKFTEYLLSRHLFQELLECVQYLHESKPQIIHKDLNPTNILVNKEPIKGKFLKLCDFDLTTIGTRDETLYPSLVKNAKYIAPEVIDGPKGQPKYTTKSDIYSLGRIACDLFDFDLNSCGKTIRSNKELTQNWNLFEQMIKKMLSPIYSDRPDCWDLLSICKNWTIDEITGDIEKNEEQNINQLKIFDFLFKYFDIKTNLFNESIEELIKTNPDGFGTVLKAWDKTDQKLYALKIIEIADEARNSIHDYQNQMNFISELREDYVVKYFNCFIKDQRLYIKMELCSDNLKNILEEKRSCFERESDETMTDTEYFISSHLAKEILECVQYLHELNPPIIHRDLKPANILVNYKPIKGRFLKIGDFGLVAKAGINIISQTGYTGSFDYLAPEILYQDERLKNVSTKSDIFSVGKIFAELFNFDLNNDPKLSETNEWEELGKLIQNMHGFIPRQRPDLKDLLSSYNEWAMTVDIMVMDSVTNSYCSDQVFFGQKQVFSSTILTEIKYIFKYIKL